MSNKSLLSGLDLDASDFFVKNGSKATDLQLGDLVKQVANLNVLGNGDIISTFKDLSFKVGDITYHYIGNWANTVTKGLLGSTSKTTGSYDQVVLEKAGEILGTADLTKSLKVDLGGVVNLLDGIVGTVVSALLDLGVGDTLDGVLEPLLGTTLEGTLNNLHLGATPNLPDLVDDIVGGNTPTNGDDDITGTDNADTIDALGGNDLVHALKGNDVVHGDNGDDKLWGQGGNDKLYGDKGNDVLRGQGGNDIEIGGAGRDRLFGNGGKDVLNGNGGRDVLNGGGDRDHLRGGRGTDILTGGGGADVFVFKSAAEAGHGRKADHITDFSHKQHDKADLHAIDADTSMDGNQKFHFIGHDHFSHDAGELRWVVRSHETILMGDTDGDGKADFAIDFDHAIKLHANDIIL